MNSNSEIFRLFMVYTDRFSQIETWKQGRHAILGNDFTRVIMSHFESNQQISS